MQQFQVGLRESGLGTDLPDDPDAIECREGFWGINGAAKRAADILISLCALVFLAPLMLVTFTAIKLDGGGAFFTQSRVGRGGRLFRMYKFRTMHTDAEAMLQRLLDADPQARAEWNRFQKLRNDPRITHIGQFLRLSSIDELPQLLNVLKGDMSIVGQRPILAHQREAYGVHITGYEQARPGITGLWQVKGRNRLSFDQRAALGTDYVRRWSFSRDLWILILTVPALLFSAGAY